VGAPGRSVLSRPLMTGGAADNINICSLNQSPWCVCMFVCVCVCVSAEALTHQGFLSAVWSMCEGLKVSPRRPLMWLPFLRPSVPSRDSRAGVGLGDRSQSLDCITDRLWSRGEATAKESLGNFAKTKSTIGPIRRAFRKAKGKTKSNANHTHALYGHSHTHNYTHTHTHRAVKDGCVRAGS
jgi:hypothetical protein